MALAGGNMLIASTVALLLAPSMPKPDAAQTQKREPRPVRTKGIGTRRVFAKAMFWDTNHNGETVDVLAFLSGRSHAMRQPYLNDDKVTIVAGVVQGLADGAYATGKVLAGVNLGLATETAFPAVISALPGIWTADHRGDGITSGYLIKKPVKAKNYLEVYPQADNTILSAVFDMSYLFDPRDLTMDAYDPDTWVKADPLLDNPVLGLLWYLITDRGVDYDTQILPVIDYWTSAADHCDELVALKGGGFERRYRCCILFDMTGEPADIISEILKTFDGWYSEDALGRYIVYSGRYYEPTVAIGPSQIVNARHQGFVEDEDFINEIPITYVSAEHDYNEPDATPWTDEDDIAERGKVNSTNFSPQTPSHSQNRRLAKRFMARQNAADRGTITTNYDGMTVIGERFIWLNHVEAETSFYTGAAEIVTSPERDMQTLGVSFDWVAVSPSIDNWNAATEEGEPAPVEDRIAPLPLEAPVITDTEAELGDGGSSARIRITVDGFDRNDVTWFARWRITTDTTWNEQEYSDIDPGPDAVLLTSLVPLDVSVDVEVAYGVGDGRVSPWSALEAVSTSTAALAPAPPTGVSGTGGTLEADIAWTNSASANLAYSRAYRNTTNTYSGSTLVSGDMASAAGAAQSFHDEPAAGAWYYFVRGFNSAGTGSAAVGTGLVTVV
ncbi:hypothetical protein HHL08_14320 [Sphingobium sp. AR-3-1]|uniref:Tip attachment protein J domain-containing protein n=1 Tax=Sphingobium psychrophilum TaxID=2728834 RepID=A0A7X9WWR5_9SPHN|nr:hypothetical protein [Sphingobium psychrophilum]